MTVPQPRKPEVIFAPPSHLQIKYKSVMTALFIYKPTPAEAHFRIRITTCGDRMFSEHPSLPVVSPDSATL